MHSSPLVIEPRVSPAQRVWRATVERVSVPAPIRREPWIYALAAFAAAVYSALSVINHLRFGTSFDLGIFDQAIWHYSHFQVPESTVFVYHPNLLGDHFHPILILLVPFYWIWSSPIVLLIAQSVLVAASAVPVFLFAQARLERRAAYLVTGAYLMYWAIHAAVAYDFHEVAFAPLAIALALLFADRSRWVPYFFAVGALLLVKEDMAFVVSFLGIYLLVRRRWWPGVASLMLGLVWWYGVTKLVIPAFADGRSFRYWTFDQLGNDLPSSIKNMVTDPTLAPRLLFDHSQKVSTLAYLFLPFLGLTLLSPVGLLAIPLIAERMFSTKTAFWGTDFHYSLAIAPVIAMGAADGLRNLIRLSRVDRRIPAAATIGAALMLFGSVAASAKISDFKRLARHSLHGATAADRAYSDAVKLVPPKASVTAESFLIPHLSERSRIFYFEFGLPDTDYILVRDPGPYARLVAARSARYTTIFDRAGLRVLKRNSPAPAFTPKFNLNEPAK